MNILSQAAVPKPDVSPDAIDFSRPFMPEELTPLFYTPAYTTLTDAQRLRYNQLNALYFNEQTMFFETSLAGNVLGYCMSRCLPAGLKEGLMQFFTEEQQHTEMFRRLNRQCAPAFYAAGDFYFIRVPPVAAIILDAISKRPQWFPFLLWLMHLQEERALYFGKAFLKYADSLEPHFVSAQRKHLADEIGHVRWDEALLNWFWPKTSAILRRLNVQMLSWMVAEYFTTPKHTAPKIVSQLITEFPELGPRYPQICRQLRALGKDPAFRRSLYCPGNVPMTFERFDAWPEFRSLTGAIPGYVPGKNHMNSKSYPIPAQLNIALAAGVVCACVILLWASGQVHHWWAIALLSLAYGFVMNTGYALCHEAEHDMFHPNKPVNDLCGTIVTLFFPASFQLRRQGHIGHHLRNRTDDEAFDLYFENENPIWKWIQFYGILTGFFWLMIVISNFIAVINPKWLANRTGLDRPTAALQETLNPKYFRLMQLEAFLVLLSHGTMIYFFKIPIWHYLAVVSGFGFIWSTLQYIHHYGTPRDVQKGARNVRTWRIFDLIWLNHHWHLNHHLSPTVPWIYLPKLQTENATPIPFWKAYFTQWRGPRLTFERVINRHAGKVIR